MAQRSFEMIRSSLLESTGEIAHDVDLVHCDNHSGPEVDSRDRQNSGPLFLRSTFPKQFGDIKIDEIRVVKNDRFDRALDLVTLMTVRGDHVRDFARNAVLICERDAAERMT